MFFKKEQELFGKILPQPSTRPDVVPEKGGGGKSRLDSRGKTCYK